METNFEERLVNLRSLDLIVKPAVRNIFETVAKATSFATLAGGYLRDSYFHVPIKDIDIFVHSDLNQEKLKQLFPDWTIKEMTFDEEDEDSVEYNGLGDFGILEMYHANSLPVQIMISENYTSVASVLGRFDFGFCQIAFDGTNVLVTDEFWKDAANNTATFMGSRHHEHSVTHQERLTGKYPNINWIWG